MEQDITLPFITVNKHKVSKSCFGWGGGGGGRAVLSCALCFAVLGCYVS